MKKLILLALFAVSAYSQVVTGLMQSPKIQFFTANGVPLSGGVIYTYAAGTTTPQFTYTDSTGITANTDPVTLDSGGFANIWLSAKYYKIQAKDSLGNIQWTVDNVANLGLLNAQYTASGTGATARTVIAKLGDVVSVKDYGAVGNGIADDSTAIGLACSAANGGTVQFPNATYKITAGAITSCAIGTTLVGNGSTLDLTSLTTYAFGINIAGSYNSQSPPTVISGFRINGNNANASAYFVRADRVPYFTMRDVHANAAQVVLLEGESIDSVFDHVSVLAPYGKAFSFVLGGYPSGPDGTVLYRPSCISAVAGGVTCVEVDSGLVSLTDPYIDSVSTGVNVNGGSINVSGGTFYLRNFASTGIALASVAASNPFINVSNTMFEMVDAGSNNSVSISNTNASTVLNLNSVTFFSQQATSPTAIKDTVAMFVNMKGCSYIQGTSANPGLVFDLTPVAAQLNSSTISGNSFYAPVGQLIYFSKPAGAGSFNNSLISSNVFTNATNFLIIQSATLVSGNSFIVNSGTVAMTFVLTGASPALINNLFSAHPTVTNFPTATFCFGNINYNPCN